MDKGSNKHLQKDLEQGEDLTALFGIKGGFTKLSTEERVELERIVQRRKNSSRRYTI